MAKPIAAEEHKLRHTFEEVRKTLLDDKPKDRLDKPLAYWALPNDRRLPLTFMGRAIGDLLSVPYHDLTATPGIGPKKISSLVNLLLRAAHEEAPAAPFDLGCSSGAHSPDVYLDGKFDAARVSELHWAKWREMVERHGLACESIGRVARSLRAVPTVLWNTQLEFYLPFDLADMRALRAHGEKRVRVVLEVFCHIHEMLGSINPDGHLSIRLVPRLVARLEGWIMHALRNDMPPSFDDLKHAVAEGILVQIDLDTDPRVVELARGRMGINGRTKNVRQQSRRLGVAPARIYELLDDCSKLFEVRWPSGRLWLDRLILHCEGRSEERCDTLLRTIRDLLYPSDDERPEVEPF
jgi:hypothetical protein